MSDRAPSPPRSPSPSTADPVPSPFHRRPEPGEYDAFYGTYVSKVPEGDVLEILETQLASTVELLAAIPQDRWDHRYAPGKWTIREVVGHVIDAERVFAYRALRFARGDTTPLPGMDQEDFMAGADFSRRSMDSLIDEHRHQRLSNLALFASFDGEVLSRTGVASDCSFTVRALIHILAGHERHHVEILKQRYLGA